MVLHVRDMLRMPFQFRCTNFALCATVLPKKRRPGCPNLLFLWGINIAYLLPRLLLELEERLVELLLRVFDVDALDERLVVDELEEREAEELLLFRVAGSVFVLRFLWLMSGDCLLPESSREYLWSVRWLLSELL